jgi:hypothetical protein
MDAVRVARLPHQRVRRAVRRPLQRRDAPGAFVSPAASLVLAHAAGPSCGPSVYTAGTPSDLAPSLELDSTRFSSKREACRNVYERRNIHHRV